MKRVMKTLRATFTFQAVSILEFGAFKCLSTNV